MELIVGFLGITCILSEKLNLSHDLSQFQSGEPTLDEWLRPRAIRNKESGASRTYVICAGRQVVGYYALAGGAVAHAEAPGRVRRNMPDPIPVMVIGRLAIDGEPLVRAVWVPQKKYPQRVSLCRARGIEEYLILLSICQTCKYSGLDFLDFLRSGETDIGAFAAIRQNRRERREQVG